MSAFPGSPPSKSWWSRSKSSKDVPSNRSSPGFPLTPEMKAFPSIKHSKSRDNMASSKLNNFVATAMGKRSKKPTLTIQDPPPQIISARLSTTSSFGHSASSTAATSPVQSPMPYFTNRPPAKSVSSTVRSYEYDDRSDPHTISEPRTPSDHPRDRRSYQNSVLTLSDPDPFAAGAVILPQFMQDPNRLSVYSDSSLLDPHGMKRADTVQVNRMSYGSSSSNSHSLQYDAYSLRPQTSPTVSRRPSNAATGEKRNRRETFILTDGSPNSVPELDLSPGIQERLHTESESSCSTVAPRQRNLSAAPLPRPGMLPTHNEVPAMRPRGMTVAGDRARRPTINTAIPKGTTAPLRLTRKPSASEHSHSHSQSPSTASTSSPILFSARSSQSHGSAAAQPAASSARPLVLVRKASSSRVNLPPLTIQPPSLHLPPTPLSPLPLSDDVDSVESLVFPDPPSAGSSSMSFVSLDEFPTADEIHHFMHDENDRVSAPVYSPASALDALDIGMPPVRLSEERTATSASISQVNLGSPKGSLRKMISQQSVCAKRASQVSITSAQTSCDDHASVASGSNGKAPKKQRSFHHPRIPLPTLRHSNSYNSSCTPSEPSTAPRSPPSSAGSSQPRRRLFSGSSYRRGSLSKGSSSPPPTGDDELRSLYSLSLDGGDSVSREAPVHASRQQPIMMSFTNMGNQLSLVTDNACIAPMWEELTASAVTSAPPPSKRVSQSDYVPQQIMSPADMLRLEEELADEAAYKAREAEKSKMDYEPGDFGLAYVNGGKSRPSTRSRASSILSSTSAATMAFGEKGGEEDVALFAKAAAGRAVGASPRRPSTAAETNRPGVGGPVSPQRSATRARSGTSSSRPATAQASLASAPTSPISLNPPSPQYSATALPPPPRPRPARTHVREDSDLTASSKRASVVPIQPLSPPPRRRPSRAATTVELEDEEPARTSRPPSAFNQRALNRRSVMRKPSFLEIDDDFDAEMDPDTITLADMRDTRVVVAEPIEMESSFLDLDRGNSFDTIRSFDDGSSFHAF